MREIVRRFFRSTRAEWLFLAANLALLAGFVVTIKAAWLALWWSSKRRAVMPRGAAIGSKTG